MQLLDVPVIDIAPFLRGAPADKTRVAEQVGRACRDIGFLVIQGHGVDPVLSERMRAVSRAFFDLPLAEKARVARPAKDVARGYIALDEESLARSRDPGAYGSDLNESLMIGPVDRPPAAYADAPAAGRHFAPNLWPERPAELRETWTAYYRTMGSLAASLMRIFALALGLPETFFDYEDRQAHQPAARPQLPGTARRPGTGADPCRRAFRLRQPHHPGHRGQARWPAGLQRRRRVGRRADRRRLPDRQHRRPARALDQRHLGVDAAPRRQSAGRRRRRITAPVAGLLPQPELRRGDREPGARRAGEVPAHDLGRAPAPAVHRHPERRAAPAPARPIAARPSASGAPRRRRCADRPRCAPSARRTPGA